MGRRFRVEFTPDQLAYAHEVAGVCRAVWNTGLDQRRQYRQRRAWINYPQQCRELAEAKTDPELAWLREAPAHCLQQALMDLDKACRAHATWKVRFRSNWVGAVVPVPRRQAHAGAAAVQAVGASELAEVRPGAVPVDPIGMAPTRMRPIIRELVRIKGESLLSTDRRSQ